MFPVNYNSEGENLDYELFKEKFIHICEEHKKQDRAMAFAFLVYDFHNPQLRKVLNDEYYWQALNEISGKYLTVFSLNYDEKTSKKSGNYKKTSGSTTIEYLTSVPVFSNMNSATKTLTDKYFQGIEISFPSILFFQIENDNISDSLVVELNEEKIEESFLELKEYITTATQALEKVTDENKNNSKEIFDLITGSLKARNSRLKFKRVSKQSGKIIGLLSSLKGLI